MGGLLTRLVGIGFALVEAALLVRLTLPFVDTVPRALKPLMPPLIEVTDALIAPFKPLTQPFDIALVDLPAGVAAFVAPYTGRVDPAVVVAMIAYALVGAVVLLLLRIAFRV